MVVECEECQNFLRLLGITQPATDEQLKAAYRDYVRVWHPDRFDSDARLRARAEEEMKRINAAYDHLCNHKESEPRRNEEPIPWHEATERPDAAPWQEVKPQHEPEAGQRVENHGTRSESDKPAWRWIKVCLRAVWRVFTIALMLSVGALLLLYLVFKAIKYFDNHDRRHKGDLSASLNAWVTEFYVAKFLGLPLLVVRVLMFISAVTLVGVGFAGSMVWSYLAPHPLIIISSAVVASLCCVCWALVAEYDFEFVVAHSKDAPRTAAWVMGLIVTLGSVGVAAYALAGASAHNGSHQSDMSVTSTSVDATAIKEASPSPAPPTSSITNEAAPISNTQTSVSPIDSAPGSTQNPVESKRLNAQGLRTLSGAKPDAEGAAQQQAPEQEHADAAITKRAQVWHPQGYASCGALAQAYPPTAQEAADAALIKCVHEQQAQGYAPSGAELELEQQAQARIHARAQQAHADVIQSKIQQSWNQLAVDSQTPKGSQTVIGFTVLANGSLRSVVISKMSGSPTLDHECISAARLLEAQMNQTLGYTPLTGAIIIGHFTASCDY